MIPVVVGFDPGFASCGFAVVQLFPAYETVLEMGVIRTSKSDKKTKTFAADDNLRRCREVAKEVERLLMQGTIETLPSGASHHYWSRRAVCAEAMSFPRSASVAAKMAMTWGVLVANVERAKLPLLQATPQEMKVKLTGRKDASKEDVEAALKKKYGKAIARHVKGIPPSLHEHAYDALASIVTCLDSEVIRMVRTMSAA